MTEVQMRSYFDLMQDKASEPYFTDAEKYQFLNAGQMSYINEIIGGNDPDTEITLEEDERNLTILQPLIKESGPHTDTAGSLSYATLGYTPLRILELQKGSTTLSDVRFVRHNDWAKIQKNTYTTPTDDTGGRAIYTYISTGLKVDPTNETDWYVRYLDYPADIASGVDCELPDFTHYKIVAKALLEAGIPTEAEALALVNEISN